MYAGRGLFQDQGKVFLYTGRLKPFFLSFNREADSNGSAYSRGQTLLPLSESVFLLLLLLLLLSSLSSHNLHGLK